MQKWINGGCREADSANLGTLELRLHYSFSALSLLLSCSLPSMYICMLRSATPQPVSIVVESLCVRHYC